MRNTIRGIVLFVNYYNVENKHVWNLIYYSPFYLIVIGFIKFTWTYLKDTLTRSLLTALGFYYAFELAMDILSIVDYDLKVALYKGKYINYILALSCGCSLLVLPLWFKIKKWLKRLLRWAKNILSHYGE